MTAKAFYTLREVSAFLGLPVRLLRQRIRQGRLAADRDGKAYYVHRDEVARYRRERQHVGSRLGMGTSESCYEDFERRLQEITAKGRKADEPLR